MQHAFSVVLFVVGLVVAYPIHADMTGLVPTVHTGLLDECLIVPLLHDNRQLPAAGLAPKFLPSAIRSRWLPFSFLSLLVRGGGRL